jgi:uncharacterized membrane protein YgcG
MRKCKLCGYQCITEFEMGRHIRDYHKRNIESRRDDDNPLRSSVHIVDMFANSDPDPYVSSSSSDSSDSFSGGGGDFSGGGSSGSWDD